MSFLFQQQLHTEQIVCERDSWLEMGGSEFHTPATSSHNGELIPNGAITGMAGGVSEFSYTRNSKCQSRALELWLKPVLQREISQLKFKEGEGGLRLINVADLGCSVGDNTLRYAELVLKSIQDQHGSSNNSPDIQYFFSDLPTNDFNTLFRQLEDWKITRVTDRGDDRGGKLYPAAMPGSFDKRLFPTGSIHVVIRTFALHYLSQVPDAVRDKTSAAYNKQRVHISGAPPAVVEAYAQLSKQDLYQFFTCRAQEVTPGGLVVLYFPARVDEEHPENQWQKHLQDVTAFATLFEETWKTLAMEGTLSEERWNSFNLPCYAASMGEVKAAVNSTDAFHIKQLQVEEMPYLEEAEEKRLLGDPEAYGPFHAKFTAAMMRAYIENHIGPENGEKFFQRLSVLAADAVRDKRITSVAVVCMLVVLIRK